MDAIRSEKTEQTGHGWIFAGLSIAVLLVQLVWLYRETTLDLFGRWAQPGGGFGHGYLVLAISLYIIYRQRTVLYRVAPCPSYMGLFGIAAFSLLWLLATLVDVQLRQNAALLPRVLSVIWAVAGGRVARQLVFPVVFIAVALPVWSPLLPILQSITAHVAFWLARAAAVPAMLQDYLVTLPAGSLMIAEACSGLHYLLAAVTLGVFYAYLNYRLLWQRVLVVMIAALAAIMANILRVFIIIYLAYTTDMQHPWVEEHLSLGWYLFAGLVFMLLLVDLKLHHSAAGLVVDPGSASNAVAPGECRHGMWQRFLLLILGGVLIAIGPAVAWRVEQPTDVGVDIVLNFPESAGDWYGPTATKDDWMPVYQGAIAEKRAYQNGARQLYLYLGYYPTQSQGSELINDLNRISDAKIWRSRFSRARVTSSGADKILEQVLESSTGRQRLVWYWYRVAGVPTVNAYEAKLLQVRGLLTGKSQAAVIAVATDIDSDIDSARNSLSEFMGEMQQPLVRMIDARFQDEIH